MKLQADSQRPNNPFHFPRVTEVLEDLDLYWKAFSEQILVGATLEIFKPANLIVIGPLGTGKSMLLNLLRYEVLSRWFADDTALPSQLASALERPFLGLSINLQRISFQVFGRRSASRAYPTEEPAVIDAVFAADYLCHLALLQFVTALHFAFQPQNHRLRAWLRLPDTAGAADEIAEDIASWDCWFGYYKTARHLLDLRDRASDRLNTWLSFLNVNIDQLPPEMWSTKTTLPVPMNAMGQVLGKFTGGMTPLYITVDQYEVLPELNPKFGTSLQRIVNTMIKARDPMVFYRVGARTYDWGRELRIWGAESRLEFNRDYHVINLGRLLTRGENSEDWLFPAFAKDVAVKRINECYQPIGPNAVEKMFGDWSAEDESRLYFAKRAKRGVVLRTKPPKLVEAITSSVSDSPSPLDLRLADAWVLQQVSHDVPETEILTQLRAKAWKSNGSWNKERRGSALLQISSMANQKKRYYGWNNVLDLSGFNISAFLLICSEIWDIATKYGMNPLSGESISAINQTEGVLSASGKLLRREANEKAGGSRRYHVVTRLGHAIAQAVIADDAISNPGHTGFSLRESELQHGARGADVAAFLEGGVNFGIFEEREHTSKNKESYSRRKWYLHPLLSASFGIPYKRVKEPLYVDLDTVYRWFFTDDPIHFGGKARRHDDSKKLF
jgi:hypothetical protein